MSVEEVVERAGGRRAVALRLGITRQAVYQWIAQNEVPAARVPALSALSGVPGEQIRPDLYAVAETN